MRPAFKKRVIRIPQKVSLRYSIAAILDRWHLRPLIDIGYINAIRTSALPQSAKSTDTSPDCNIRI